MKTLINFLFKKRIKILKSKRGFSLLEVLVAVGIIAIISAIAYPSFDKYRTNAAQVAADTSASNVAKAIKNCMVLGSFAKCKTLNDIQVSCPSGSTCNVEDAGDPIVCVDIKKGDDPANPDFNTCIAVNTLTSSEQRTYGGKLLASQKICHFTQSSCTTSTNGKKQVSPIRTCTGTGSGNCGTAGTADTDCTKDTNSETCEIATTNGTCNSSGNCS